MADLVLLLISGVMLMMYIAGMINTSVRSEAARMAKREIGDGTSQERITGEDTCKSSMEIIPRSSQLEKKRDLLRNSSLNFIKLKASSLLITVFQPPRKKCFSINN
jgi:hypothetical protein